MYKCMFLCFYICVQSQTGQPYPLDGVWVVASHWGQEEKIKFLKATWQVSDAMGPSWAHTILIL